MRSDYPDDDVDYLSNDNGGSNFFGIFLTVVIIATIMQ
jgi:hypothetical protein